ncbi:hypothetical protein [Streptomyces caniscabiei]|uniref:hypothetical protein n=2 Tax=Streptomyces TaxID=1883 RepID=UPI001872FF39|nr:hypothetical protein [Streptomyces caniscabiei]MBE4783956.1 hypothetical protein [Streptomyces caniscabiei]MBE4791545.1 hypothetical protein [Streptomyces caniscabiei]MDX3009218.1 hypothetical protein [Streptomyces caniscabiei]
MSFPERMRYVLRSIEPGVPVGRQRDWIAVPMGAPTVWMATPSGLVDVDLIAVERAINGLRDGWTLTPDEAFYAATVGFAHGLTYSVIAKRLGVSGTTMLKWFPGGTPKAAQNPRQAPRRARQPVECGTDAGYRRHYRLKEPTCAPCRAAKAVSRQHYLKHGTYVMAPVATS